MNNLELSKPHEEIKTFDRDREGTTQGFVTSNPKMLRIMDIARRVAQTDVPILILVSPALGKTCSPVIFTGTLIELMARL